MSPALLTTLAAFVRRDWRIAMTYRVPYVFDILAVIATVALFYYLAQYARPGDPDKFFAFLAAGLAVVRINTAMVHIVQQAEVELAAGSLSYLLSSRLRPATVLVGIASFPVLRALVFAVCTILLAIGFEEGRMILKAVSPAAVLLGLIGSAVVFLGLAAGTLGAYLIVRLGPGLSGLISITLPLLAGAYFPVGELPKPLRAVAHVLPFDDAVELLRDGLLHGQIHSAPIVGLVAGLVLVLPLGFALLHVGARYSRRAGTLEAP